MNVTPNLTVLGTRRPRQDGRHKVSGRAVFTDDVVLPGMLHGRILRSPYPKARIIKLDTSEAEALPGVKAVVTADDAGLVMATSNSTMFVQHTTSYIGEAIAAVAAIDSLTAEKAVKLIRVEYEILPSVTTLSKAMKPGAPQVNTQTPDNLQMDHVRELGDLNQAFSRSFTSYSDEFESSANHNVLSELQVVIADWSDPDKLKIWTPSQAPFFFQRNFAKQFGLAVGQVQVICPHIGGAFSGRGTTKPHHYIAILLSKKTRKPVKIRAVGDEEFTMFPGNGENHFYYETTVNDDGVIQGIDIRTVIEGGRDGQYHCHLVKDLLGTYAGWLYQSKGMRYKSKVVLSNNVPYVHHHGGLFGHLGAGLMQHTARIAEELGMDPIDFHIKNAVVKDHVTHDGAVFKSCGLIECLEAVREKSGWKDKYGKLPPYHGIGVGIGSQITGYKARNSQDSSSVFIRVDGDGAVTVITGIPDLGQGSHTVLAMMAAESLGIPLSQVQTSQPDTDSAPHDPGAFGQRGTFITGNAVVNACEDVKQQLAEKVAIDLKVDPKDLEFGNGKIFVRDAPSRAVAFSKAANDSLWGQEGRPIMGRGFYNSPVEHGSAAYSFGAQVCEVEVEPDTGTVHVKKFTVAHDVGRAMNPLSIEGQIDGQVFSGMSMTLFEECVRADGQVMNPSRLEYKTPRTFELPEMEYIIVESIEPYGPFGAKEVGEGPIEATFGAVASAVANALGGVMPKMPMTPWRVLQAIKQQKRSLKKRNGVYSSAI